MGVVPARRRDRRGVQVHAAATVSRGGPGARNRVAFPRGHAHGAARRPAGRRLPPPPAPRRGPRRGRTPRPPARGGPPGQRPGSPAAGGFAGLLADPAHGVVLAVLPDPEGDLPVGLAVLG